jgi:sensor histidine kinase YesM
MKNILRFVIIMGMLAISFFISFSDVISIKKPIPALDGKMDLSKWDFLKNGPVNLDGQWELYDNQLLAPEDFQGKGSDRPRLTGYIKLTSTRQNDKNNKFMKPKGVRTYRLVVKVRPSDEVFGLKLENVRMSNKLFINGTLRGASGNPAEINNGYHAGMTPYDTYFNIQGGRAEIIIQSANFGYPLKGTLYKICFGLQKDISFMTTTNSSIELAGTILMFLLAVYSLYVYAAWKKDKSFLYLGISCLSFAIDLLFNGEKLLVQLFPVIPFELECKIKKMAMILTIVSLAWIVRKFNKNILSKITVKAVNVISVVYALVVLTVSYPVYMYLDLPKYTVITTFLIMIILKLTVMNIKNTRGSMNKKEAGLFLEAIICLSICLVNNFLYELNLVSTKLMGSSALCGFIVLLFTILSNRFLNAYRNMGKMSVELIRMDKVKNEFIARTSYELKAPLYGIINITETIIKENSGYLKDKNIKDIIILKNMALKLTNLINDTLDITLLKNGQLKINICTVDVKVCANIVVESYKYILQKKNINIINNISREVLVKADENRIKQVIFNLVGNAVKNMDKGTIKISCSRKGDMVYVSVEDTGPGIPEDKQHKVFMPYESLNPEGIGLSLYITKQLVELMKGEIYLDWSEKDRGSCFVFSLPVSKEKSDVYEENRKRNEEYFHSLPSTDYSDTVQGGKNEGTILIVDDEILNVQTALNIFYREGYNILTALSGEEALKRVEDNKVDLVLLDVMMPGISGIDVCRKIREKYSLVELPILISTLKDMNYDLFLGFEAGANDFITKPFEEKEITARVRTLIQLKKFMEDALKNEMAFLQAQIKPHFLYNTISTIISFCYTDGEKAAELLTDFSRYLRLNFDIDNKMMLVPLRHELEMVDAYIEIEKARFGDKVHIEYDVEKQIMGEKVPVLCIQPLVENAVKHGLLGKREGGTVYVSARKKENAIYISVKDNGIGMNDEKLEKLKNSEAHNNGVGLSNISRRIRKLQKGDIDIHSIEGKGTIVDMFIKSL